ncbi:hypothetical protein HY623_03230 [Candidatus Uhrbacteria bacterium]|nr:hypothetical protein [Candidatus Uhrbacteria bacterium]
MKLQLYLTTALLSGAAYLLSLYATSERGELDFSAPATVVGSGGVDELLLFLLFFACATAFMIALFRIYRGTALYRVLFSLVAVLGLVKLFETVFPLEFSATVALVFLLGLFVVPTVWTHDIIVILASAGIGSMFALNFSEYTAIALLLILSLYDGIAVVVTKHMIALAHEMIRHQATFALFVPERLRGFAAAIGTIRPGAGFLVFGGGDLVLPMIYLSVIARESTTLAGYGVGGALVGQFLNHMFLTTLRKPIPALPLIALGAIAGVALGRFI